MIGGGLRRRGVLEAVLALLAAGSAVAADVNPDMPPPGTRSLFDRLVQASGGIPFPFERLQDAVAAAGDPAAPPVPVLIPAGRSLVRHDNNYVMPRILLAATGEAAAGRLQLLKNRLFIGYSEPIAQLEVISFNPDAGRFEFQVVDGYRAGETPKLTYAHRAFCLGCHQGAGPIFSVRPWGESNAHPAIAEAIRLARKAGPDDRYHGAPLRIRLADVEEFDNAVGAANDLLAAEAFWRVGCGGTRREATDCRRLLLAQAVAFAAAPGRFDPRSPAMALLLALQAKLWPAVGLTLPSGDLLDRTPPPPTKPGWLRRQIAHLGFGGKAADDLPPELDPQRLRPRGRLVTAPTPDAVYAIAALFGRDDRERLRAAAGNDPGRLAAAVLTSVPATLFAVGPPVRARALAAIMHALGADTKPVAALAPMPAPVLAATKPLALAPGSDLEPFARYCFGCHRGSPMARLDLMRGDTADEVWANLLRAPRLVEVLDWEHNPDAQFLMPPVTSQEYLHLKAARAQGDDALAAMHAALAARGVTRQ